MKFGSAQKPLDSEVYLVSLAACMHENVFERRGMIPLVLTLM